MPSTKAPPRRPRAALRYVEGQADPLHHELELALLFGRGAQGIPVELSHVDGWRRAWGEHRDIIEPKAREYLPGRRAWARYVCGELPAPPLLREPPLSHDFYREWIAGTGKFWTQYPEPWQRNETAWLVELGEVDAEEHERYLERLRRPRPARRVRGVWRLLGDYPLEAGRYA